MPKPMHRSRSMKRLKRVTSTGRKVTHYRRAKASMPHCAICRSELNGISLHGGKSRRTNSRKFGGVLCGSCTANIIKLGSRIENGEMKLDEISVRQKAYILQLLAH